MGTAGFKNTSRRKIIDLIGFLLRIAHHLAHIAISVCQLPLDNAILLASYAGDFSARSSRDQRRQATLQNVHFYPKTILITGIDTPHGLSVARCWYYEGHRVVGADVHDIPIRSGGSMSKALGAFYHIPKSQYVSQLLDIVNREKADVWIPCSGQISVLEDAMAKQVLESRTNCKCVHLDTELTAHFGHSESFAQYLSEKGLPAVENQRVQSRDSVHKILHRSPTKVYLMRRLGPLSGRSNAVALPKRTTSQTYSEVSEIQISKDTPWMLQQQTRLGELRAEMLVVRGYVHAIKVRPADQQTRWGDSRLDEGLMTAIHKLMESFAVKGGSRMTAHLAIKLMVDEEFDTNSVRHAIHISGCTQGATAVKSLLQDPSCSVVPGYLGLLSPHNDITGASDNTPGYVQAIMPLSSRPARTVKSEVLKYVSLSRSTEKLLDALVFEASRFLFWRDARFSWQDPLPWWWHVHIYRPLREIGSLWE